MSIKLFKSVDEQMKDLGFVKIHNEEDRESKYGVSYERESEFGYVQRIDILHKESGNHLIQSYQLGTNSDGLNNVVGITYQEAKIIMKKFRQMKRKYGWK